MRVAVSLSYARNSFAEVVSSRLAALSGVDTRLRLVGERGQAGIVHPAAQVAGNRCARALTSHAATYETANPPNLSGFSEQDTFLLGVRSNPSLLAAGRFFTAAATES